MSDTKFRVYEYSVNQLEGVISSIVKDGEKIRNKIQNVGLSIIRLWGKREISPGQAAEYFTSLTKASPYHGKAVSNWIVMFTPCKWSNETKGFYAHEDDRVNGDNFKEARDNPFWEVSPPPEPKPFDAFELLNNLLAKNAKRSAEHKEGDHVLPADVVNSIREVIASAA